LGWSSAEAVVIGIACLVLVAGWVRHELRSDHPLVDLRHLRSRPVLTADIAGFLMSLSMYLIIRSWSSSSRYLFRRATASVRRSSCLASCSFRCPLAHSSRVDCSSSTSGASGSNHDSTRSARIFGGVELFAFDHDALWEAFVTIGIAGLGIGFTFAAMPGFIIRSVPHNETGSATGFYQVLRNIGLSVGSALSAAILLGTPRATRSSPRSAGFRAALLISAGVGRRHCDRQLRPSRQARGVDVFSRA